MILLNVAQELSECAAVFEETNISAQKAKMYSKNLLTRFVKQDGRVIEFLSESKKLQDTLLAQHINPGHLLSLIYFISPYSNFLPSW